MRVVICAAGRGRRLAPLTDRLPKPLVPVGGRPLIARTLTTLARLECEEVVFVCGYRARQLRAAVEALTPRPPVRFVANERFETTNSIVSLALSRPWWEEDFCVVDSDMIVEPALLERAFAAARSGMLVDFRRPFEQIDMRVEVAGGKVQALAKTLPAARTHGEFVCVSRWTGEGAAALGHVVDAMLRDAEESFVYDEAMSRAARLTAVDAIDCCGAAWLEIDSPRDLAAAEAALGDPAIGPRLGLDGQ